jgi:hypothetical protein
LAKTGVIPTDSTDSEQAWFNTRWRPAMAWQYLIVCLFDFMVAPILMGLYSTYTGDFHSWEPLTIRGGGLYHLSMGAVVGVAVWSRGKEKMMLINTEGSATEGPADEIHNDLKSELVGEK